MTRIILVRHGQTAWNKVERFRGQYDVPLNETGLAQADLTGVRVVDQWRPVAVYCSPLQRAVQTAQAIACRLGMEARPLPGLNDMNFGQWQGLSPEEVQQRWPDLHRAWFQAPHTVTVPGGESLDMLRERATAALRWVIDSHPEDEVAVVAHTVVNRVLLMATLGLDNSNYWRIHQDTCAINVIEWHAGVFYIGSINDSCHLRHAPQPA